MHLAPTGVMLKFLIFVLMFVFVSGSSVSTGCALQPIPLHAISDIMDFHNIRSATYSLDVIGAPTWREASMCLKVPASSQESTTTLATPKPSNDEDSSTPSTVQRGWYWGKYIGRMVGIRNKSPSPPSTFNSIDTKMNRKRQLLRDYYAEHLSSDGFSNEFSVMSDLPMQMGWLRKRRPKYVTLINSIFLMFILCKYG